WFGDVHKDAIVIMEELGDDDAYQQEQLAICLRLCLLSINCHYLRYSPSAYYDNIDCQWFFGQLAYLLNFVFMMHLMNEIFGYTNDLCIALQRREQDIVTKLGQTLH
ncbi:hypothetical protein ACJX0J_033534, partial [Zea mays]